MLISRHIENMHDFCEKVEVLIVKFIFPFLESFGPSYPEVGISVD
jgi:hypothetical protein